MDIGAGLLQLAGVALGGFIASASARVHVLVMLVRMLSGF
jgi:hypothetical protein